MAIDYAALRSELQTDPNGYGYAARIATGDDAGLADILNEVRPTITVRRADIAPAEILEAIDTRDIGTGAGALAWFQALTRLDAVRLLNADGTNTRVIGNMARLIGDTNGSQARLQAIASRPGSRAEKLFGVGARATNYDIARAFRPEA